MKNLERLFRALLGLSMLLLLICAGPADEATADTRDAADDWVKIGGSLRLRGEWKRNAQFGAETEANDEDYGLSQLRLWADLDLAEWFDAHIELQDAHIFDQDAIDDTAVPSVFADELDLHQGYLDVRPSQSEPIMFRLGRQKFNMGEQRLVSPLEWVNTARVWDGVRLNYGERNDRMFDLFASVLVPVDPTAFNDREDSGNRMMDSQFHGIYVTDWNLLTEGQVEAYLLYRKHDALDDKIYTFGARAVRKWGSWSANAEGAGQTGTFIGTDHSAWMAHAEVAKTLSEKAGTIGAALNMGSGDADPLDDTHKTFDNLYPLNHAFYGYMDYFALQNLRNLELSYKVKTPHGVLLRIAYQAFWLLEPETDAWYVATGAPTRLATGPAASAVGSEVDITLVYNLKKPHVGLLAGYSHFLPGQYVEDTGLTGLNEAADFFYLQSKLSFGD